MNRGLSWVEEEALDRIESATDCDAQGVVRGCFGAVRLESRFQPIFSLPHQRAVGYEALMRPSLPGGEPLSPPAVFGGAREISEAVRLDRLCRNLHVRNFCREGDRQSWLFLNVHPLTIAHGALFGAYFSELLERYALVPRQVVIEIVEDAVQDEGLLAEAIGYYKRLGCLVAIDDFGTGASNFNRVWRTEPDLVKFDRSLITQATHTPRVRRALASLVALVHESGSLALQEGIETAEQAHIALDAGIDLVQGFHFARPGERARVDGDVGAVFSALCRRFRSQAENEENALAMELAEYREGFARLAADVARGRPLSAVAGAMLARPRAERCYLLDAEGRQIGATVQGPHAPDARGGKFSPLSSASGAVWFRRPYFLRAMAHPGEIQTSRPYLSIAGGNLCLTLSVTLSGSAGERQVLCCDLAWED